MQNEEEIQRNQSIRDAFRARRGHIFLSVLDSEYRGGYLCGSAEKKEETTSRNWGGFYEKYCMLRDDD